MDDLDDGLVDAGVEADDDQAAHEGEDGADYAQPVASASTSLAVADRGEHDRTPVAQEMALGNGARALYEVFSHINSTAFRGVLAIRAQPTYSTVILDLGGRPWPASVLPPMRNRLYGEAAPPSITHGG